MASGLALSLGWPLMIGPWLYPLYYVLLLGTRERLMIGPWLYPLYYVLLLGTRERDDDRRCAEKYGAVWEEYRKRVPWRIVPGIY
jgi:delta14-sterol reductase